MDKKTVIIVLLVCFIVFSTFMQQIYAASIEDFNDGTWVEIEESNIITIEDNNTVNLDGATREIYAIIEKNLTQPLTDFEIRSGKTVHSHSTGSCMPSICLMKNYTAYDIEYTHEHEGNVVVWICHKLQAGATESIRILGRDEHDVFFSSEDQGYEGSYAIDAEQTFIFKRVDTNVSLEIYNSSNYTSYWKTIYLYNFTDEPFYYILAQSSYNIGGGGNADFDVFDVQIVSYNTSANPIEFLDIEGGSNGTTIYTGTPTINWSVTSGALHYQLQIDNNNDFSSPEVNLSDISEETYPSKCNITSHRVSFTIPFEEKLNKNVYYMRVRALT